MRAWQGTVSIISIVALVAPAEAGAARRDPSDWARVQRGLERGARITVRLGDGETVTGRLAAAEEDHLSIRSRGAVRTISRAEIREVRRAGRSPFRKWAGFLLGAAGGAVMGALNGRRAHAMPGLRVPRLYRLRLRVPRGRGQRRNLWPRPRRQGRRRPRLRVADATHGQCRRACFITRWTSASRLSGKHGLVR
jgi:hypothetical protein